MSTLDLSLLRSYARMAVWSTGGLTIEYSRRLDGGDLTTIKRALEECVEVLVEEVTADPAVFPEVLAAQAASIQKVIELIDSPDTVSAISLQRIH